MDGIGQASSHPPITDLNVFEDITVPERLYGPPKIREFQPLHSLTDSGPVVIDFWSPTEVLLLQTLQIIIKLKIVHDDGSKNGINLTNGQSGKVSSVNMLPQLMWSQISQELNNQPINEHSRNYGRKVYVQHTFSYSRNVKKNNLVCELFIPDDATNTDEVDGSCNGFKKRAKYFDESKSRQFVFNPLLDFSSEQHFLAPTHKLTLSLERQRDDWCLFSLDNTIKPKIKIEHIVAQARCLQPLPRLNIEIEKKLKSTGVQYKMQRNVIRSYTFPDGSSHIQADNIFRGPHLPRALYAYFLENDQIQGKLNSNPLVMRPFNIRECYINLNGETYPLRPLKFNFTSGEIVTGYNFMLNNLGKLFTIISTLHILAT